MWGGDGGRGGGRELCSSFGHQGDVFNCMPVCGVIDVACPHSGLASLTAAPQSRYVGRIILYVYTYVYSY